MIVAKILKSKITIAAAVVLIAGAASTPMLAKVFRQTVEAMVHDYLNSHPEVVQKIAKDYIVNNPSVMQEALAALVKRRIATAAAGAAAPTATTSPATTSPAATIGVPAATTAAPAKLDKAPVVKANAEALFKSPSRPILGNRDAAITIVEFFDYNCGYCRRALADKTALTQSDSNIRFSLREFPVLGPNSEKAARVAIALRMQDPDGSLYARFHNRLLSERGIVDQARALAVAQELGADVARLEADIQKDSVTAELAENHRLATALGANGTPTYVVQDDVIVGAVGSERLRDKAYAAAKISRQQ